MAKTFGEEIVGVNFNPSNLPIVDEIKKLSAALIDKLKTIPDAHPAVGRLVSIAVTNIETASMYGVKAATKKIDE